MSNLINKKIDNDKTLLHKFVNIRFGDSPLEQLLKEFKNENRATNFMGKYH